jgi:hypothetical protein
MSGSQQALLVKDGVFVPPPSAPAACVADAYYSCSAAGDTLWTFVTRVYNFDGAENATTAVNSQPRLTGNGNLTASGNAKLVSAGALGGTGTSATFDGSGDYFTVNDTSSGLTFGTADFCVEAWVKTSDSKNQVVCENYVDNFGGSWQFLLSAGRMRWVWHNGTFDGRYTVVLTGVATTNDGNWHHIAASRASGVLRFFVDGVSDATVADANNYNATFGTTFSVGAQVFSRDAARDFNGMIGGVRLTTSNSRYPTAFTIAQTKFLLFEQRTVLSLHCEDTTDSSCYQPKTVTLRGSATVSTAKKMFGASSFLVPYNISSNANGIEVTDHQDFDFGTEDWTIEFWAYRLGNTGTTRYLLRNAGTNSITLTYNGTTGFLATCSIVTSSATRSITVTGTAFPPNQWVNFVLQRRASANLELYVDGTLAGSNTSSGVSETWNSTANWFFGRNSVSGTENLDGYLDEIRVTKGVARYTSSFTPATNPNCDSTTASGGGYITSGTAPLVGNSVTTAAGTTGPQNLNQRLTGISSAVSNGYVGPIVGAGAAPMYPSNLNESFLGSVNVGSRYALHTPPYYPLVGQYTLYENGRAWFYSTDTTNPLYPQLFFTRSRWLGPESSREDGLLWEFRFTVTANNDNIELGGVFGTTPVTAVGSSTGWQTITNDNVLQVLFYAYISPLNFGTTLQRVSLLFEARPNSANTYAIPGVTYSRTLTFAMGFLAPLSFTLYQRTSSGILTEQLNRNEPSRVTLSFFNDGYSQMSFINIGNGGTGIPRSDVVGPWISAAVARGTALPTTITNQITFAVNAFTLGNLVGGLRTPTAVRQNIPPNILYQIYYDIAPGDVPYFIQFVVSLSSVNTPNDSGYYQETITIQ